MYLKRCRGKLFLTKFTLMVMTTSLLWLKSSLVWHPKSVGWTKRCDDGRSTEKDRQMIVECHGANFGKRLHQSHPCGFASGRFHDLTLVRSYWSNGSIGLTAQDSLYHVSGGQWHPQSNFADPYFGSTHAMTSRSLDLIEWTGLFKARL